MPARCPVCARFLSHEFIAGLLVEDAPCPKCATTLSRHQFHGHEALVNAPQPLAESVRPPDLPQQVAAGGNGQVDPLVGWDVDANVVDLEAHRSQKARQAMRQQLVATGGSAAAGALLGALLFTRRRGTGALVGAAVGGGIGAISTRVGDVRGLQRIG